MALFDKFKKSTEDAKNNIDKAKAQITQTRDNIINKAGSTVLGNEDTRPYAPQEVLTHEQHECIRVRGERYYQEKLTALPGNFVELDIGKRMVEDREYYHVSTSNGEIVGDIYPDQLEKAGLKKGAHVLAEIHRPIYRLTDGIVLYIPMTEEAIENKRKRDALKLWVNLDADKWNYDAGERFDFEDVEILVKPAKGNGKPTYVVIGDGSKLFEVNPRMKMYAEFTERKDYKPRRLIVESRTGDYGPYYHMGFYY